MSVNLNIARIGNFTSSEIVSLMANGNGKGSFGKAALSYIEECNIERRLLRSIQDEITARPLLWGSLVEMQAFESLGLEYTLNSQDTVVHPEYNFWSGSADGFKEDIGRTVIDIKSPFTLKSFCMLADCQTIDQVREKHKDGEKFYWQLVSNATIHNCKFAELIIYMPYQKELQAIRDMASEAPPQELYKYFWIANGNDEELPHLIEGGYYKNLYVIRFEVPQADKDLLTERVIAASKLLQPFHESKKTA